MTDLKIFLFLYTEPLERKTFDLFLNHTDPVQRKKILSFRVQADVDRSLLGFTLSKYIGMKYFKCPEWIRMGVGEHGKPFYIDQNHYHFNISHSGEWVTCGADTSPVGCDVQLKKKVNLDVAERFFHPDEYQYLTALPEKDQEDYFYTLWVLKESYIKALGKGFSHGMKSYHFDARHKDHIILSIENKVNQEWKFVLSDLDTGHKCAVCMRCTDERIKKMTVGLNTLIDFFKPPMG